MVGQDQPDASCQATHRYKRNRPDRFTTHTRPRMLSLPGGAAAAGVTPGNLRSFFRDEGKRDHHMELARNLKTDSVSRLQPTEARVLTTAQTVADAVALMR